jgi:UDP-2,3-diacylglucosamine pyrophosphatase LpxH
MNVIGKHEDLPIGAIGDIHGEFGLIRDKINYYKIQDSIIFMCGDFGVGFNYNDPKEPRKEKKRLQDLNSFVKKRNIFIYVVRGNHDNPMFFDGNHNLSNLIFMKDYDIVEVGEYSILGIGGATSVDRKPNHNFTGKNGRGSHKGRREGVDWWPNEKVFYDEKELDCIAGIDVVITHTAPSFVNPPLLGGTVPKWCECDVELKDELITEREIMSKIYHKLEEVNYIKKWVYGHYHQSSYQIVGLTTFQLIDIAEFTEIRLKKEDYE